MVHSKCLEVSRSVSKCLEMSLIVGSIPLIICSPSAGIVEHTADYLPGHHVTRKLRNFAHKNRPVLAQHLGHLHLEPTNRVNATRDHFRSFQIFGFSIFLQKFVWKTHEVNKPFKQLLAALTAQMPAFN